MYLTRVIGLLLALLALGGASCGGGGGISGDQLPIHGITDGQGGADDPFGDFDPSLVIPEPEVFRDVSAPTDDPVTKWKKNCYDPLPAGAGTARVFQNASLMGWADRVLALANQERIKAGLPPLSWDPHLERLAQSHARDMGLRDFFAHENPYGLGPFDRFNALQPPYYNVAGENAARGQESPEELISQWMNSPKHRDNLLHPAYTHIGIGAYFNRSIAATPSSFIAFFCQFNADPTSHEWYEPGDGDAVAAE
jgi:uncharacterized protein YkwD